MIKYLLIVFLFFGNLSFVQSQNLSGFWKGTLTMRGCFPQNNIELQFKVFGNEVIGSSYHYLDIHNYIKKEIRGTYDKATKTLTIQEGAVTTYKIPHQCVICIKRYVLQYSIENDREVLKGEWSGKIQNSAEICAPGTITLSRVKESAFKEIPEIPVDTGEIRLDFYDNGEIDGDSISVLVNKRTIIAHQKLSAKPITSFIRIDLNNTFQEIEMVAENIGSIPPNTALLIITAGSKRYRLFLTSTETKSAMVRFVYERNSSAEPVDSK